MSNDGSETGLSQQRYDANGNKIGAEDRVNTTVIDSQNSASLTTLSNGEWLVTWVSRENISSQTDVYQQRYGINGKIDGEILVNKTTAGDQNDQSTEALTGGGWIVTWTSQDDIYQQRYNAQGQAVGDETLVNTITAGTQDHSVVAELPDGGWLTIWESGGDIHQQRYSFNGSKIGGEARVNTTTSEGQSDQSVTSLADGGWVVTWTSQRQDGSGDGVFQQRYNAAGQAIGGEILVNTTTTYEQEYSSVTALPDGGWIVTWQSEELDHSWNIYQQRFTADGQKVGPTTPTGLSLTQAVAEGHIGSAVQIATKAFVTDGNHTYTLIDDAGGRFGLSASGALVVKDGLRLDYEQARSHMIKVQVRDALGATYEQWLEVAVEDVASENLIGSAGADVLKGGRFKDTFNGAGGNDRLWGGLGNDVLKGSSGRDIFVFDTKANTKANKDKIADFKVKDDTFWLDNAVFTKLGRKGSEAQPSKLSKSYFALETAKDRNDHIIYSKKKGVLSYDADGSGTKYKAVEIATLSKNLKMTHSDFYVI